jgi:transcriptional regulator with GAF, ATPase, and Fis domain
MYHGCEHVDVESRTEGRLLPVSLADHVTKTERTAIETALAASRGRISGADGAARRLGLPASTLEFRIKRLAIDKFRYRQ